MFKPPPCHHKTCLRPESVCSNDSSAPLVGEDYNWHVKRFELWSSLIHYLDALRSRYWCNWSIQLVGGLEHVLFFHIIYIYILWIIIPTDYFFSEELKPPTRQVLCLTLVLRSSSIHSTWLVLLSVCSRAPVPASNNSVVVAPTKRMVYIIYKNSWTMLDLCWTTQRRLLREVPGNLQRHGSSSFVNLLLKNKNSPRTIAQTH